MATATPPAKSGKKKAGLPARRAERNGRAQPLTSAGAKMEISALGKGAYEIYEDIELLFKVYEQSRLVMWWKVGQKFVTITEQWKEEGLTTFCKNLFLNHREVRMAMRAATTWTKEEIDQIAERATQQGGKVTWSHLRQLLTLDDADRDRYLTLIETQRMGYRVLVAQIDAEREDKKDGGKKGGRQFNVPSTFDGIVQAGLEKTALFNRFFDQMDKKLPTAISKIDENRYSSDLLNKVRKMRTECDNVEKTTRARADQLTEFERRIEQKLGLQPDEIPPPSPAPAKRVTTRKPPSAAKKKD
jgi:hypothetical protein